MEERLQMTQDYLPIKLTDEEQADLCTLIMKFTFELNKVGVPVSFQKFGFPVPVDLRAMSKPDLNSRTLVHWTVQWNKEKQEFRPIASHVVVGTYYPETIAGEKGMPPIYYEPVHDESTNLAITFLGLLHEYGHAVTAPKCKLKDGWVDQEDTEYLTAKFMLSSLQNEDLINKELGEKLINLEKQIQIVRSHPPHYRKATQVWLTPEALEEDQPEEKPVDIEAEEKEILE